MKLKGKRTHILAIISAVFAAAYIQGLIPIDEATFKTIMSLLGGSTVVTMRMGISNGHSTPTPTETPDRTSE